MARKKETVKEEIKVDAIEEVKDTKKTEELKVVEPITVAEKNPMVKVIPMKDLSNIYIGGKFYSFTKNVEKKVPADVERVLRERDLIK